MSSNTESEENALKQITEIREHRFDPGDEAIAALLKEHAPERALEILRLAARVDGTIKTEN